MPIARPMVVVERDRALRDVLPEAPTGAGYRVAVSPGGQEALEAACRNPPEAVLLDLDRPPPGDQEFLDTWEMAARDGHIPLIVLSAGPELPASLARLGVQVHLMKPFGLAALLEAVGRVARPLSARAGVGADPPPRLTRESRVDPYAESDPSANDSVNFGRFGSFAYFWRNHYPDDRRARRGARTRTGPRFPPQWTSARGP